MDRLLEFVINHYILVSAFFILWAVFFSLESKRGGQTVSPQQATNMVNREDARVVDLRDADEFRQGHVAGSINIPMSQFAERIAELDKFKEKPVILVCKMGTSASLAGRQLRARGFDKVARMQGGIQGWRADNLPVVKA
jgi:rhodanese-related sulfurtransferase